MSVCPSTVSEIAARLSIDVLDRRDLPALIASQQVLTPPTLTTAEVGALLSRAAAATASDNAIIAVVDRNGTILGVRVEGGVDPTLLATPATKDFAIDGAVAEARTAALFANDTAPLTSRTIQEISQTTITQREVESDPNLAAVPITSPLSGPGFVAPIGTGGHFPPNVARIRRRSTSSASSTPTATASSPTASASRRASTSIRRSCRPAKPSRRRFPTANRSCPPAPPPAARGTRPPLPCSSRAASAPCPAASRSTSTARSSAASASSSPAPPDTPTRRTRSSASNYNPALPDLTTEAEFIAVAAAGGSKQAGVTVGALGGIPALPGFDIPFPRIDLGGITLDTIGPGGIAGPQNLLKYAQAHFNIGGGNPASGANQPVNSAAATLLPGKQVPSGWLVTPHASAVAGGLTAAQVTQIINQGIATANATRAQIRTPRRQHRSHGLRRRRHQRQHPRPVPDARRDRVLHRRRRRQGPQRRLLRLQPSSCRQDQLPGVPVGTSFSNRTFRYLAAPRYPISVQDAPPGFFSSLNDPNISRTTGLQTGPALPPSAYNSILLHDSFFPNSNFHDPNNPQFQNGIVFFPGSAGVYVNGGFVGGFGVSGDGVDQDDFVTSGGIAGFDAPVGAEGGQRRLPQRPFAVPQGPAEPAADLRRRQCVRNRGFAKPHPRLEENTR